MVNLGPSGRCNTCRQRRVKCDEAKPECHQCVKLGRRCGGYEKLPRPLKIKDQSHKFPRISIQQPNDELSKVDDTIRERQLRLGSPTPSIPSSIPSSPGSNSMSFFLGHCVAGRSLGSSHGFFEVIMPLLSTEPQDSALSTAATAVASKYFALWVDGPKAFLFPDTNLNHSLARLRAAIQHPIERSKPSTILAALLLHWYENTSSVFGCRKVLRHHYHGALALLPLTDLEDNQSEPDQSSSSVASCTGYMARYLIHLEVSLALREGRSLSEQTLVQARLSHANVLPNPSSILDELGASIADLRARFIHMSKKSNKNLLSPSPYKNNNISAWFRDGLHAHLALLAWAESVPADWHPLRLLSGEDFDPLINSYLGQCDVYPSCQIASTWNLWRWYRIMLAQMFLILQVQQNKNNPMARMECDPDEYGDLTSGAYCQEILQQLIDDICFTIPFFLGNRTRPSNIADFTDRTICLPCHHSLPRRGLRDNVHVMSKSEHKRHIIAQGPWHIMGPLGRLLNLFAGEHGWTVTRLLRPQQHDWIRQQFIRVTTLVHLPIEDFVEFGGGDSGFEPSRDSTTTADYIARGLHEGLNIIGGT